MRTDLFSLVSPCPDGFAFCQEYSARRFRSAPFALIAKDVAQAETFFGPALSRLAGLILIPGECYGFKGISLLLSVVTYPPALSVCLAEFAVHQLDLLETRIQREERSAFLQLENARLEQNSRRSAEEFNQFRLGLVHQMEERRIAQEQLVESEKNLRSIIENMQDVYYRTDADGRVIMISPSAFRMFGYDSLDEIIGKEVDATFYSEPSERQIFLKHLMEKGSLLNYELTLRRKDGTSVPVATASRVVCDKHGKFAGIEGIIRDVTNMKEAEQERLKLEQQLLHARKLESLGVLAGGIAHDFNNILTAIIGNADLALFRLRSHPESPVIDNLRRIEDSAARAADLARQMLAYSGKGKFVVESVDLNVLVEEMVNMLTVAISRKVALQFQLHRPLPPVRVDATQIRQVVMNLVINAHEAIGENSGEIGITTGLITCDEEYLKQFHLTGPLVPGPYVLLEIRDTGCGMSEDTLSRIFDPFFTTKFTGRGLGMAAVLGIVRGHHGGVQVVSSLGEGSRFLILLPVTDQIVEKSAARAEIGDWKGEGKVLLVDDEEIVRDVGCQILENLGFEVLTATDGREALELFYRNPEICVVILDLTMPNMDGGECFRELQKFDPDVKVILSSGYSEYEVTKKFSQSGLAGFIQKPYRLEAFKERLREILS